jgi:hypothetical protein
MRIQPTVFSSLRAATYAQAVFQNSQNLLRVTRGNHSRNWSTVASPSGFSNMVCTGTCVPVKTMPR